MLIFLVNLARAASPDFGGEFQSQIRLSPAGEFLDFQDSLMLSPRLTTQGDITLVIDLDMRWSPFVELDTIEDAQDIESVQPLSIRTEELWLQHSSTHFTTTIGMQNIRWGIGKGISQVNWMAPLDLRNPTIFSEHISVPAIKLAAHKQAVSTEFIVQPWFVPALLPQADISLFPTAVESFSIDGESLDIRSQEGRLITPSSNGKNIQLGGQAALHLSSFDIALFAFYGRDTLPQANGELLLMGFQTDRERVDIGIPLEYPTVITFGATGELLLPLETLLWFEITHILPEETQLVVSETQMQALTSLGTIDEVPDPLPSITTQNGEQYTKWLLGIERYFGDLILSGQWVHGLFIERQAPELTNYFILHSDWAIRSTLRWNNTVMTDGAGIFLRSDVHWLVQDEIDLGLGGLWVPPLQDSALNNFNNTQQVYGSVSYIF